ncbi:MAG: TVP38/TMEM64 family protein, partial [Sphingomonas bacterium]|nr:TVP38/TMEM64 family protein [Sphingomonas bacterium]
MKGLTGRIGLLLLIAAAIAAFFLLDLGRFLTLDYVKDQQAALGDVLTREPALVVGGFFLAYVAVTSLSLPGAAIMTLAAGAIFGLWLGTLIVSFASAIGATLAFLSARYVLRDWVKSRFPKPVRAADRGVEKDGHFYLLTLRLIPVFPFFLVNLAMGLTAMRVLPYFLISQVGM